MQNQDITETSLASHCVVRYAVFIAAKCLHPEGQVDKAILVKGKGGGRDLYPF